MQEGLDEPGLWAALEGVQALIVRSATQVTQQVLGGGLRCFCHRTHHRVAVVWVAGRGGYPSFGGFDGGSARQGRHRYCRTGGADTGRPTGAVCGESKIRVALCGKDLPMLWGMQQFTYLLLLT